MSSGSKESILSLAILTACLTYVTLLAVRHHQSAPPAGARGPVHLAIASSEPPPPAPPDPRTLRVCADPNNMPFSDRGGGGFENQLAILVAQDLGRQLEYYWQPQRRGFIRRTLTAGYCDLIIGLPSSSAIARVTRPYYRSTYVFVSPRDRRAPIRSLDDPRLRHLQIGIPMTGQDYGNPPAAQALANRRILDNVHGYPVYGDYSAAHPSWGVLDALVRGQVDVAIAWGPIAGYAVQHEPGGFAMAPVVDRGGLPFAFDISMAVRPADAALAAAVNGVLARRAHDIRRILVRYGVPLASQQGVQG
jgi:mxaJ protein